MDNFKIALSGPGHPPQDHFSQVWSTSVNFKDNKPKTNCEPRITHIRPRTLKRKSGCPSGIKNTDLPYLFRTFFNVVFFMVGSFFRESWCVSILVFSMVFHLQKVSSKNSYWIKSYGCFKTGYKWRHLLPVYLVPEGFHEITAVSRVYMAKIQKQSGQ